MSKRLQDTARETVRDLQMVLPCAYPVKLGKPFTRGDDIADTEFTGKSYIIRVRERITMEEALASVVRDAIMHEYAHARVWGRLQAMTGDHDGHWGMEYARVYRELLGVA